MKAILFAAIAAGLMVVGGASEAQAGEITFGITLGNPYRHQPRHFHNHHNHFNNHSHFLSVRLQVLPPYSSVCEPLSLPKPIRATIHTVCQSVLLPLLPNYGTVHFGKISD